MNTPPPADPVRDASRQQQFLNVISRDEAVARFRQALRPSSATDSAQEPVVPALGTETVPLHEAQGRVLAGDVAAPIDVPGFDRANVDGFALRAADTAGAREEAPRTLKVNAESLLPGVVPRITVTAGTATPIATGGMVPRGADAVLMIEDSELREEPGQLTLDVMRAIPPGQAISFAGSDVAQGETVLWTGTRITSREIGVLAALGATEVTVRRRPRVAIISTGDEVISPGEQLPPGCVYDSNAAILSAAVTECGGEPVVFDRVRDDLEELDRTVQAALEADVVLLSGGTSKGAGDLSYRVVQQFDDPGIVAHGVALKPGKPICLAVTRGKPVVILPGFPTSAIFTYHEFVAPVIRSLAGIPERERTTIPARLPMRLHSEKGRTEYMLVRLFRSVRSDESTENLSAYPMGKGSGSVTTFSLADGFITIAQHREILEAGERVEVTLFDRELRPADLVVIGSHCTGLDFLLSELRRRGRTTSVMHVGSLGGLAAVRRGECDLAGIHLLDPETDTYNAPFLDDDLLLIPGYRRMQCFVFRSGDERFTGKSWEEALQRALEDPDCVMINRNPGSGTRILTDRLLPVEESGSTPLQPPGYAVQVKSHNAVAAAVHQGRADWGIAIDTVARAYGLDTIPIQEEHYDFVTRKDRADWPTVAEFRQLLDDPRIREDLQRRGFASP
jgi:putative molybdopterin biosynthesis protein